MPPYPEQSLNSWRFDGTSWLTNTRTGPLVYDNLQLVESWSGHALQMTGPSGLLALPNNQPDGTPKFTPAEGTIRLWFATDWTSQPDGTGPGAVSRLFEVGAWSATSAQGWWSLAISPDGTLLGFLAQDANGQTPILQTPIRWQAGEWHQIALSWSDQETVLFVDGLRAATGPAVSLAPLTSFSGIQGFCIGSDVHGGQPAGGQFEELFTFDRPCSDLEVVADYARTALLAALGPITVKEEQAMIAAAEEQQSLRLFPTVVLGKSMSHPAGLWLQLVRPAVASPPILKLFGTKSGVKYDVVTSERMIAYPCWHTDDSIQPVIGNGDDEHPPSVTVAAIEPKLFYSAVKRAPLDFEGMDRTDFFYESVPDTMGAAGCLHYVEIINGRIAAFKKSTGERESDSPQTTSFFIGKDEHGVLVEPTRIADARVLYDQAENRWVASALFPFDPNVASSGRVILAVSRGPDPRDFTGGWTKHALSMEHEHIPGFFPDFPTLGIDANGIYVTWTYLTSPGPNTHDIIAINKQAVYEKGILEPGDYTRFYEDPNASENDPNRWTVGAKAIQPVVSFDPVPAGGFAWFLAKAPPETTQGFNGGAIYYRAMEWRNGQADWVTGMGWQELSGGSYRDYFDFDAATVDAPTLGPEPGTSSIIQLGPGRGGSEIKSMPMMRGVNVWVCYHVGLAGQAGHYDGDASGSGVDRSAIQWLRLAAQEGQAGAPPTLQYVTHRRIYSTDSPPVWYYYPSLMVNRDGDLVIGFSGSSQDLYISAFYAWQKSDGSQATDPQMIKQGQDFFSDSGWGDYSATSLDPVDGRTFWTIQAYKKLIESEPHDLAWGTWIARIVVHP